MHVHYFLIGLKEIGIKKIVAVSGFVPNQKSEAL